MDWLRRLVGNARTRPRRDATSPQEAGRAEFGAVAPKHQVAVVGDIHGRVDLLDRMLVKLENAELDRLVFVGDYVDRGDNSAEVLDRLRHLDETHPEVTCLKGNHEKMLLDFIDRPEERGERWIRNGGLQTLASFGLKNLRDTMSSQNMLRASDEFRSVIPDGLEHWLRTLPLHWHSGNVWVVHAGADPRTEISEQSDRTLLWGHKLFRKTPRSDGLWVVHGHTIVPEVEVAEGVISVDTGAYATGTLSAALLRPSGEIDVIRA